MTEGRPEAGRFFDGEAGRYDAAHDGADSAGYALRGRIAVVLRLLGPRPGSVLDCGMGPGRLLAELERRGWSVGGIDISGEMVALARSRLPEAAGSLLEGTIESLPFPSESFAAAVATGVLEYVEDVPRTLDEVARVLRPGGLFVVSTPNTRAVGTLWRQRVVYPAARVVKPLLRIGRPVPLRRPGLLSAGRLEELLAAAGLDVERVEYCGFFVLPERLSRSLAIRVAERIEGRGPRLRRLLGQQLVVAARKAAHGDPRSA